MAKRKKSTAIFIFIIMLLTALIFATVINYFLFNSDVLNKDSNSPTKSSNSSGTIINNDSEKTPGNTDSIEPTPTNQTKNSITISFAGDILLDRGVKRNIINKGYDYVIPAEVREHFSSADIAMVNLENPFSNRGTPMPDKEWTFRADPEHFSLINMMGIDIVNIANNHILDYGQEAFLDTLDLLEKNKLPYIGGGRNISEAYSPKILEKHGKKFAFLGANRVMPTTDWYATETRPGLAATYKPDKLIAEIEKLRGSVDYIFVYAHWGVERNELPEDYQRKMARQFIDAGADGVIASHPHIMQGFEIYKDKPIAYSLGNFIFTDASKDTAILKFEVKDNDIKARIIPCQITSLRTLLMDSSRVSDYFRYLESISFGVRIDEEGYIIKI